jgi:ribosomal protein L11 methyltransferase
MATPVQENSWHLLNVELEPSAREAVEYALMEAGALGTETKEPQGGLLRVTGYFPTSPNREEVRTELIEALRIYNLPSSSVREMTVEQLPNRDWLEEWKKNWQPTVVGRFIISPPWSELKQTSNEIVIRIEPGMAFGTGTHETTRLCLSAIEKHFVGGSFLDIGTGTGILAIAAAKLFPDARIEACDNDEEAIEIARTNAQSNEVAARIDFRAGSVDETTPSADLVCANLTADVITPMLRTMLGLTCGKLILSGILETQEEGVLDQLRALAVSEVEVTRDGEWICCVV